MASKTDTLTEEATMAKTLERCRIHPDADIIETNPADPENGPSPDDLDNEVLCLECYWELEAAAAESMCLAHRRLVDTCTPCLVAD